MLLLYFKFDSHVFLFPVKVPQHEMCKVSKNGTLNLVLESPWANIYYHTFIGWNVSLIGRQEFEWRTKDQETIRGKNETHEKETVKWVDEIESDEPSNNSTSASGGDKSNSSGSSVDANKVNRDNDWVHNN